MSIVISGDSPNFTSPTITGAVVSSMASSVITSGTAQASTSGTSIDFTGIPSWVKRITVMFQGVSTSGSSPVQIQLGAGSIQTTGYIATAFHYNSGTDTSSTSGFITDQGGAANTRYGNITICAFGNNKWQSGGNLTVTGLDISAGGVTLSGTLDRIRITTVGGIDTFDAGSINILYE